MSFHFTWGGQPEGKLLSPEHSSLAQEDKCISVPEWENYTILSSLEENMYWVCTLCTLMMYIWSISIWIMLNLYLCNSIYVHHYDISLGSRNRRETRFQKKLAENSFWKLKIKQQNFLAGWMFPWAGHRLTHPKNPFKNMQCIFIFSENNNENV